MTSTTQDAVAVGLSLESVVRRSVDICLGILGLGIGIPIMLLLVVLIRLDSPGPAWYVSPRLGQAGRVFRCLKLRTMFVDGDRRLAAHLAASDEAKAEWETYAKLRTWDPRVTRVGKWLRRLSLDELPQLFNIVAGQMSLVGPRPYLPRELQDMGDEAQIILRVKPGLTGLWQVSGRNEIAFSERVKLEADYVLTRTILMDAKILFRTVGVVLGRRGAF